MAVQLGSTCAHGRQLVAKTPPSVCGARKHDALVSKQRVCRGGYAVGIASCPSCLVSVAISITITITITVTVTTELVQTVWKST